MNSQRDGSMPGAAGARFFGGLIDNVGQRENEQWRREQENRDDESGVRQPLVPLSSTPCRKDAHHDRTARPLLVNRRALRQRRAVWFP